MSRASTADDDAALVHEARHGDRAAFAVLVERHLDLVRSLCVRWLADPTGAEDVVQDAVLAAMTSLDKLNRPGSFGPWLAGIALNTARGLARRQSRSPISLEVVLGGRWIAEPRDAGPGPDAVVEHRLLARRLTEVVASLPVGQAAASPRTSPSPPGCSTRASHSRTGATVDARPSDALNIAVLVDAPVRVDPEVVAAANSSPRRPAPGPSDHPAIAAEAMAALASLVSTEDRRSGT